MSAYQPKTGAPCTCKPGIQRDNCPGCEGTGWRIDFRAIRERVAAKHAVHAIKPMAGVLPDEKPSVTIQFAALDDAKAFLKYKQMADAQDGTVSGLHAGLMCSALKRATILR